MFNIFAVKKYLKSVFNAKDILIIAGIISLFLASRLINLDRFPIFSDEGIYIHWAKVAWHDATWRFISLTDGRQPLQTWGTIPFLKLFPDNLLLGGRLFAVATGLIALSGYWFLLFYLFGKKAAHIGSFLYIVSPYFLFYDRLAMIDSGVNASFVWLFLFSLLLVRTLRLDVALLYGLGAGLALLAKSSTSLFLGFGVLAPLMLHKRPKEKILRDIVNYFILFLLAAVIAFVIYNIQRLSPFLHFVGQKNNTFVMSLDEFRRNPFMVFWQNLPAIPLYIAWEMGFVVFFIGLVGWFLMFRKEKGFSFYFSLCLVGSYIAIAFFNKILFPRYLIFMAGMLLVAAAYALKLLPGKKLAVVLSAVFIAGIYFNYSIIFDYKNIPFPPVDRGQYLEGWPAGWGMKEIIAFAREKSREKPVQLVGEGTFGMSGDVLDSLLKRGDNIAIASYWPLGEKELLENQKFLGDKYVYVVFSHRDEFPQNWPIRLLEKFTKPGNKSAIYLFELTKTP